MLHVRRVTIPQNSAGTVPPWSQKSSMFSWWDLIWNHEETIWQHSFKLEKLEVNIRQMMAIVYTKAPRDLRSGRGPQDEDEEYYLCYILCFVVIVDTDLRCFFFHFFVLRVEFSQIWFLVKSDDRNKQVNMDFYLTQTLSQLFIVHFHPAWFCCLEIDLFFSSSCEDEVAIVWAHVWPPQTNKHQPFIKRISSQRTAVINIK